MCGGGSKKSAPAPAPQVAEPKAGYDFQGDAIRKAAATGGDSTATTNASFGSELGG